MPRGQNVSLYGSMQGALGGGPIQRDYMTDPRRIMGQQLMQQGASTAPIQSHMQGLARLAQAASGAYTSNQALEDMQGREQTLNQDMMKVLAGGQQTPIPQSPGNQAPPQMSPGGYEGMTQALGGIDNPDIAPFAQQLGMQQMQQQQALQLAEGQRAAKLQDAITLKGAPGTTSSGRPSSPIQNFAERQRLVEQFGDGSPEVRRFDDYVRSTKVMNLGGEMGVFDPSAPGAPSATVPISLKPGEEPAVRREQAEESAIGAAIGKEQGAAESSLAASEAALPRLEGAVKQLKALGETATYTLGGQAADFAARQAGMDPSEGATSRAAYIAHVKNNVLPLLRQTFGAAFTVAEGESLLATLGDPDQSPGEKNAVLDAFISDKKADLETLRRQTGGSTTAEPSAGPEDQAAMEWATANPGDPRAAAIMDRLGGR